MSLPQSQLQIFKLDHPVQSGSERQSGDPIDGRLRIGEKVEGHGGPSEGGGRPSSTCSRESWKDGKAFEIDESIMGLVIIGNYKHNSDTMNKK